MTFSEFYESLEVKSDKGTIHDYINGYYSNEFTSIRYDNLKILEIGVHRGASIQLLKNWFINSDINGIDTFDCGPDDNIFHEVKNSIENVNLVQSDAYIEEALDEFDSDFDYIIDDGPHTLYSQLYSIRNWYDKLKIGGKLIIEDIQSNSDLNSLIEELHKFNYSYKVFDFTKNKDRYDDIILEVTKK